MREKGLIVQRPKPRLEFHHAAPTILRYLREKYQHRQCLDRPKSFRFMQYTTGYSDETTHVLVIARFVLTPLNSERLRN